MVLENEHVELTHVRACKVDPPLELIWEEPAQAGSVVCGSKRPSKRKWGDVEGRPLHPRNSSTDGMSRLPDRKQPEPGLA